MQVIQFSHVVVGVIGLIMFCTALWEIKTVILKKKQPYRRALVGWSMLLFFLMQIIIIYDNMQTYPKWAMIVVLVGTGFGVSGSILIVKSSQEKVQRET